MLYQIFVDLDGTLCGESKWTGFLHNTWKLRKLRFQPPNDITWSILTARPKIDRFWVKRACKRHKFYPQEIITSPTWFYNFDYNKDVALWKFSILSGYVNQPIYKKVIYIDDDVEILNHIPQIPGLHVYTVEAAIEMFKNGEFSNASES